MRSHAGLILISASALAFEVTLTRLFAVQQFHHFAFLVVSLAVMGFAASGVVLSVRAGGDAPPQVRSSAAVSVAYAASVLLGYLFINTVVFDSYSIAWDRGQIVVMLLYLLALGAPFLFAGWTIGAALAAAGSAAHRPYAANLVGSAIGVPLALLAMPLVGGEGCVLLVVALGMAAAAAFSSTPGRRWVLLGLGMAAGALAFAPPAALTLRLSPYKPLSLIQLVPDAQHTVSRWGPAVRVDVVESDSVHSFPGLSLNTGLELPRQAALYLDGDGPLPITELPAGSPAAAELAVSLPASLAYQLRPKARALMLQPGAGLEALVALGAGATQLDLAQDEALVTELLRGPYAARSAQLLNDPRLTLLERPSRGALHQGSAGYDVVHFALSDPYRPVTNGAFSLTEHYPLTVEALADALDRLKPDGLLVLTRWLGTPPSESARAWATLLAASEAAGITQPGRHLLAFRGMRTATMIASRQPFNAAELRLARQFMQAQAYDPIWLPDLSLGELNQHNRLPEPVYHRLYAALLDDPLGTIADYQFNLRPPTDDRPFFYHFFRWGQTPEVLATLGRVWQPFGGSGYLVLVVLLAMVLLIAGGLVLVAGRLTARHSRSGTLYFACIGLGFLMIEIPLIQQLTLLLDRAALAFALVLFTVLLGSGVGSWMSTRLPWRPSLLALAALVPLVAWLLPPLIRLGLPWPLAGRLLLAALPLAPLGLLMGVPFASGLRWIEPGQIPWAWAVNGAFSGIAGVAAAMLTLDLGMRAALLAAALAYFGAWLAAGKMRTGGRQPIH